MKYLIFFFLILTARTLYAQDAVDDLMYKAYLSDGDQSQTWKSAISQRQSTFEKDKSDLQGRYRLALARFGLMASTMRTKDEDLFDEYYKLTVKMLEEISEADKKWAEPYALLSAVYGLKMGYSPMQGMFLGSKSNNLVEKAKKLDPRSALAWKVYANSKFFTPETFGGDIHEAIEAYEHSIRLNEEKPSSLKSNWMYLDALVFLGQAFLKNGETGKAIAIYEKALQIEPEFGWVKHVLLPKAKARASR